MSKINEYRTHFNPGKVPEALAKLVKFEDGQTGFFSQSFELGEAFFDTAGLETYSTDPAFIEAFRGFAQADGTGSIYALWSPTGDWETAPVVAFGSEGGVQMVAENLVDLFRILGFDAEPMISWDEIIYYKGDDAEPSAGSEAYAKWLKKTFQVDPADSAEKVKRIVKTAQDAHGKKFAKWMKQYYES